MCVWEETRMSTYGEFNVNGLYQRWITTLEIADDPLYLLAVDLYETFLTTALMASRKLSL